MAKRSLSFLFTLEIENPHANKIIEVKMSKQIHGSKLLKIKINSCGKQMMHGKFEQVEIRAGEEDQCLIDSRLFIRVVRDCPFHKFRSPSKYHRKLSIHLKFSQISVRNPMELEAFHYKISEIWDRNLLRLCHNFLEIPKICAVPFNFSPVVSQHIYMQVYNIGKKKYRTWEVL